MSASVTPAPRPSLTPRRTGTPRSLTRVGSLRPTSRPPPNLKRVSDLKRKANTPVPAKTQPKKPQPQCPNPDCENGDVQEHDGRNVCLDCGAEIPDANMVSEVTFGESASGAAVVQGGFIGEGQRYAKTMGSGFRRGEGTDSREITESNGRDEIRKIANFLKIGSDYLIDRASNTYKVAVSHRFILGRRVRTVAAVCLYTACRLTGGESTVLLIDFAEAIKESVFKLGEVFQDLRRVLYLKNDDYTVGGIPLIEVEDLIQRYCQRLEFGTKTQRVANDAARILKRMKRDWMVTGRQPSGLCGSCIVLAARMNNFRRTAREVAYIVKVADITLGKRLEEFNRTDSAALSVDHFRQHALRIKKQHDPPVMWEHQQKAIKKRKLQELYNGPRGNPNQVNLHGEGVANDVASRPTKLRRDAEGFAIPPKPVQIDPALTEQENSSNTGSPAPLASISRTSPSASPSPGPWVRPRGRRRKGSEKPASRRAQKARERPEMRILTPEDLQDEETLEREIENNIQHDDFLETIDDVLYEKYMDRASKKADEVRTAEREQRRQETERQRHAAGLVIEISDGDDSDDEPDPNEHRGQPPGDAPKSKLERAQNSVSESAPEPVMSGALPSPPATATESTQSPSRDSRRTESPELVTPSHNTDDTEQVSAGQSRKRKHKHGRWDIPSDPEISPSEFDSDDEVKHCRLSEADVLIKEKIWVTENEEWLRSQQAKQLRKAILEARNAQQQREMSAASQEQEVDGTEGPKKKRRRRGKMGDGEVVREGGPPKSAGESAKRMYLKRGKGFSKHIDRGTMDEYFEKLYTVKRTSGSSNSSSQRSREGSDGADKGDDRGTREGTAASAATEMSHIEGRESRERDGSTAAAEDAQSTVDETDANGKQTVAGADDPNVDAEETQEAGIEPEEQEGYESEDEQEGYEDENEQGLEDIAAEYGDEEDNLPYYEDDEEVGFSGEDD